MPCPSGQLNSGSARSKLSAALVEHCEMPDLY